MKKLNLVSMVLLALAVIATAVYLSVDKSPAGRVEAVEMDKLLRKLADRDADVSREAEKGLRALGSRAAAPLREAARSSDRLLAERAGHILRELEPPVPSGTATVKTPPVEPAPEESGPVRITIRCSETRIHPGQPLRFYVRLSNVGSLPVLVARDRVERFARFEAADDAGRIHEIVFDSPGFVEGHKLVSLVPGDALDLHTETETSLKPGLYQVRFVYDASEGSRYREVIRGREGEALPSARLTSNAVALQIVE